MVKHLTLVTLVLFALMVSPSEAKTRKAKKGKAISSRKYKPNKHARKSRRFRHHGTGPDLKAITTESPYKEDPTNGVTPVETKQPGL